VFNSIVDPSTIRDFSVETVLLGDPAYDDARSQREERRCSGAGHR